MTPIVILGAGGFGAETAALIEDINRHKATWKLIGFLDDDPALVGTKVLGFSVLGSSSWLTGRADLKYVVAIGNPRIRLSVAKRLSECSASTPTTLVHPTAAIHASSRVGPGGIICRGVTITVNVQAGRYLVANLNCTVGHDAILGDYTTLHPAVNISGCAQTGPCVEVGTSAVLIPGVRAGAGSVVGAGAVVAHDLPERCVAVGVPAKPIRSLTEAVAS